jgi:S-formylglutathione hydrolase FrmB
MTVQVLSKTRVGGAKGGYYLRIQHASTSTNTDMVFGLYLPSSAPENPPVLYYLSGLTCDESNFSTKAGSRAFDAAEK